MELNAHVCRVWQGSRVPSVQKPCPEYCDLCEKTMV